MIIDALTQRELEVMRLVAKGYSNKQISEELFIAPTTTLTHIRTIYEKFRISKSTTCKGALRVRAVLIYQMLKAQKEKE